MMIALISSAVLLKGAELKKTQKHFEALKSELRFFAANVIELSEENVSLSNANVHEIYELKNLWTTALGSASTSKTPIECYLNLQRHVESLRRDAALVDVTISPQCHFGFSQYLVTANLPTIDSIHQLDDQSQRIKTIVTLLLDSYPKEILFIKRESVNGENDVAEDLFVPQAHHHSAVHSIFSPSIFKVSFIGTTQSLRSFINKIESMANPIFIQDIEVGRHSVTQKHPSDDQYSAFSVTLEVLNIKEPVT